MSPRVSAVSAIAVLAVFVGGVLAPQPAQAFELGVLGGINFTSSQLSPLDRTSSGASDVSFGLGYAAGVSGTQDLDARWRIELGIIVTRHIYNVQNSSADVGGVGQLSVSGSRSSVWIEIPVVALYSLTDAISIGAGPFAGFRVQASDTSALETSQTRIDSSLSTFEWGGVVALQGRLPIALGVLLSSEVRGFLELRNLDSRASFEEKYGGFQFLIGPLFLF